MTVTVEPRHEDAIGTHLHIGSCAELLSADALHRLTESLLEHVVIRITADEPIDAALVSAVAHELGDPPSYAAAGAPFVAGHEIIGDSSAAARSDDGRPRVPAATESLHQDFGGVYRGLASHAILHTRDVAPALPMRWVSQSATYTSLPGDVRSQIDRLRAIHSLGPDRLDGARRPLVLRHPGTGLPVLHLPLRRDAAIEGMDDEDAAVLMSTLWAAVETSPACYEHVLESGDLVIWDNIASVHDNPALPRDKDRVIWFLTIPAKTKVAGYHQQ
jgi:alpha-ketoglutarate-dependent taurine dioxygenase